MKLVNLNVAIKVSNTDKIVPFLQEQDADFVVLQEAVRSLAPTVHAEYRTHDDIAAALAHTLPHNFFGPSWVGDAFRFGDRIDRHFGGHIEQGLDVFSKYPFTGGSNEFFHRHFEYMVDWSKWRQEDHGRSVQISHFLVDGKPLQILNLHGIWTADKLGDARTLAQCEYIIEVAKRRDVATIIAGDFNLQPHTPSIQLLNKHFRNLISEVKSTSTRPTFQDEMDTGDQIVDYIFVNDGIKVGSLEIIQTEISDHLPLVLNFTLR